MKPSVLGLVFLGFGLSSLNVVQDSLGKEPLSQSSLEQQMRIGKTLHPSFESVNEGRCVKEVIMITVPINYNARSAESIIKKLKSNDKQVYDLAKQSNIEELVLQNQYYSLSSESVEGLTHFKASGVSTYSMSSKGEPLELFKALTDKGFNPGLTMNRNLADGAVGCAQ